MAAELADSEPAIKSFYSPEILSQLDIRKIPQHVAIIMDGNRRWARQLGHPPMFGHWQGAETLSEVVRAASELGVRTVTVFAFSTENWFRPETEVEALMGIFETYLTRKKEAMVRDGIRLRAIGDLSKLPEAIQLAFCDTAKATERCSKINLVLAMNYGGRDEIRRAMQSILSLYQKQQLPDGNITEELISGLLDTAPFGDPELLIRTSGELRISNFLNWQISYAEIYTSDVLWPDFTPKQLFNAVLAYQKRTKRRGT